MSPITRSPSDVIRPPAVLGGNVDWVALLEAAYGQAPTHDEWAEGLVGVARRVFREGGDVGLFSFRHPADCSSLTPIAMGGRMKELMRDPNGPMASAAAHLGPALIRDFYYPPTAVSTAMALVKTTAAEHRMTTLRALEALDITDTLGLVVHPLPGVATVLFVTLPKAIRFRPSEYRTLTQVALHVEAGQRLRLRPESVRAVLTPAGRVEHLTGDASERDALREHVKVVESARRARNRRAPRTLDPWTALVRGEMSLVERYDGGRRQYLFVENAPARQPIRALTRGEVDVVAHASRGHSSKMVAYALGIAESTVSHRLGSAANKVGLASRMDIVRIAAMLARDPRAGFEDIALTTAERHVLELVAMGLTNLEIARMRNRSIRTIANQVASLLAKTGASSRRGLAARQARSRRGS